MCFNSLIEKQWKIDLYFTFIEIPYIMVHLNNCLATVKYFLRLLNSELLLLRTVIHRFVRLICASSSSGSSKSFSMLAYQWTSARIEDKTPIISKKMSIAMTNLYCVDWSVMACSSGSL